ncbi:nitrous oxide reductase family maturation protein NosD [Vibrio sp. ZSDZ65]|uniref:Nitrous oxide reductase family maturation protein NosD n=1 Tax=Vibrio qingdaonensis TaxID=2829491 RepID=A0A9X3CLU5_9VIBR|nr:nitrous oxide reductase family maturation protein NosD [Vibrio qingdaonensis]MCW8344775.1 nitrous oxide reductase family maturation protein NosD [Vibrio qingdaonensis]
MISLKHSFWLLIVTLFYHGIAFAAVTMVSPNDDLQYALNHAQQGDTIVLTSGRFYGNYVIPRPLTLTSQGEATVDAQGIGNAITLKSSDIEISNLTIVNWGRNLTDQNAGIYSDTEAERLYILNNHLNGDGFGMWIQRAQHITIENNTVVGNPTLRSADRGNGIQLSTVKNALVSDNTISQTRDGLYIISSQQCELRNNTMHTLRYGIHYMYSHSNRVIGNLAYNTRAGFALMSSKQLQVIGNTSRDNEDYGMLMNFITHSTISYNQINNIWTKPENKVVGREGKGLFVYNSGYNEISHNIIDTAEIGIHLTAGSENVNVTGNSFINNPIQVKYVSNQAQEWSINGKGNYWSNYLGWDLNNSSTGDTPFEPNDGIDKIVWKYPESKVLLDSPAILMLRWIQKQFPVLKPSGVKDSYPLMSPPNHSEKREQLLAPTASQIQGSHS